MSRQAANPFLDIGAPPEGNDPEAQLSYLKTVVAAFHASGNPRIKPLSRKLDIALEDLARGGQKNDDPTKLAKQFAAQVDALRLQTYDLLLTVINQVRATLRVKLKQGMPPDERVDSEKLQEALGVFAQGLRKLLSSIKKGNSEGLAEGGKLLDDAGKLIRGSGSELLGSS